MENVPTREDSIIEIPTLLMKSGNTGTLQNDRIAKIAVAPREIIDVYRWNYRFSIGNHRWTAIDCQPG